MIHIELTHILHKSYGEYSIPCAAASTAQSSKTTKPTARTIPYPAHPTHASLLTILGTVFRVSPNELSFCSTASWKAIYGHRAGQPALIKSPFYDMYGASFKSLCIGSERSPEKHARMKKSLAPAFSAKALAEQEDIVSSCVDRFVAKIGECSSKAVGRGFNMTKWYEMVAFDILGELGKFRRFAWCIEVCGLIDMIAAFGESFHSIENGVYPALRHLGNAH
jgi:hypothetical protein